MPSCVRNLLRVVVVGFVLGWAAAANAASLDGLAVEIVNKSEPVLCAEKDNVALALSNNRVRSFRIEAAHPVYTAMLARDSFVADWTACDMSADPAFKPPSPPRRVTFYEDIELWVTGYTFPSFWRPATVPVRIGERVETGLHLIQVWLLRPDGAEEVLVLYPQDGYWRPRPMTPAGMRATSYGSSFLIGPVEEESRPIVKFKQVTFDPKARTFTLTFERGGSATLRIVTADQNRLALDVAFDKPVDGRPFAMLRSMYVTEFNNDVARIAVREKGAKSWREDNVMKFGSATATDLWAGRLSPSRHNTASPDLVFNSFSDTSQPKRPKAEAPPGVK